MSNGRGLTYEEVRQLLAEQKAERDRAAAEVMRREYLRQQREDCAACPHNHEDCKEHD